MESRSFQKYTSGQKVDRTTAGRNTEHKYGRGPNKRDQRKRKKNSS